MAALSRYTQPNQEINCYAAAAKYLEDNPDAKADLYPAWLHYVDIGKAEGRAWPSGLCNTCSETTHGGTNGGVQTNCDSSNYNGRLGQCFNQGSTTDGSHHPSLYDGGIGVHGEQYVESHSGGGLAGTAGFYTYEEGLRCTDKCRGMHDAAVAEMVGATSCECRNARLGPLTVAATLTRPFLRMLKATSRATSATAATTATALQISKTQPETRSPSSCTVATRAVTGSRSRTRWPATTRRARCPSRSTATRPSERSTGAAAASTGVRRSSQAAALAWWRARFSSPRPGAGRHGARSSPRSCCSMEKMRSRSRPFRTAGPTLT